MSAYRENAKPVSDETIPDFRPKGSPWGWVIVLVYFLGPPLVILLAPNKSLGDDGGLRATRHDGGRSRRHGGSRRANVSRRAPCATSGGLALRRLPLRPRATRPSPRRSHTGCSDVSEAQMSQEASPVVFVVGAAGGIGTALCRRLAARGTKLVLAGRSERKLQALAKEVGGDVVPLDARDIPAVGAAVSGALERHTRLDGAVNLAGRSCSRRRTRRRPKSGTMFSPPICERRSRSSAPSRLR